MEQMVIVHTGTEVSAACQTRWQAAQNCAIALSNMTNIPTDDLKGSSSDMALLNTTNHREMNKENANWR